MSGEFTRARYMRLKRARQRAMEAGEFTRATAIGCAMYRIEEAGYRR